MMTELEKEILQALLGLEDAVARLGGAGPKPDLLPLFARIEELGRRLPAGTDPNLNHYLQKKSYQKARQLLQGLVVEAPSGACRR